MKSYLKHFSKEYFNFSRKDRNGILVLSAILLILVILNLTLDNIDLSQKSDFTEIKQYFNEESLEKNDDNIIQQSLFKFDPNLITSEKLDSLLLPSKVKSNLLKYRNSGGKIFSPDDFKRIYGMNDSIFSVIKEFIVITDEQNGQTRNSKNYDNAIPEKFDPNVVSYTELVKIGFNQFQANNILEYRKKGGRINQPKDLLKIYGIDSQLYQRISGFVIITDITSNRTVNIIDGRSKVELNSCNSEDLIKLNGIGEVLASRIIKYRNLLDGFYSINQLLEVYGFPVETLHKIKAEIVVDTTQIKMIRLNFADFPEIRKNPYLKKEEINSILKYRSLNGPFNSLKQLDELNLIDSLTFVKITHYFTCR